MSNHPVAAQPFQQPISRTDGELQHAIKRNIGSSTTSLTAFAISHQDKLRQPVSLSPFEYASPLASHSNLHSLHHSRPPHQHQSQEQLTNGGPLDSEELDFDTAYDIINESIDNFHNNDQQQFQRPRTPDQNFHSLKYKSPNAVSQLKLNQQNDEIYQDHRRAIIQAGLQAPFLNQQQQQQQSPFSVSPHTRNLLHSVNSMATAYQLNNSGYELLSITESSALEKFLDSVVDDSRLSDLGRHWTSIDPLAKTDSDFHLPRLVTEGNNKTRSSQIPDLKLQKLNTGLQPIQHPIPANHVLPLSYLLSPSDSPLPNFYVPASTSPTPPLDHSASSTSGVESVKKKRGRKKKIVTEDESNKRLKSESASETESSKARRLMLTEEQKKQNHTESEKKRRAMIKTSYDKLLETIKDDKCYHIKYSHNDDDKDKKTKRGNSRYAVMNCVINEIEWLLKSNHEMEQKLQAREKREGRNGD